MHSQGPPGAIVHTPRSYTARRRSAWAWPCAYWGAPACARTTRRPASGPHLSISLLMLRDILQYLSEQRIGCYRLSDSLAPYLAHPSLP